MGLFKEMRMSISELKSIVEQGKFPKKHKHFAGAGLIITDDPTYTGHSDDVVVCTPHAGALGWLVYALKEIYKEKIDYMNKYDFYPSIGLKIKEEFSNDGELIDAMLSVIDEMQGRWS
jgi:hypothetical protein